MHASNLVDLVLVRHGIAVERIDGRDDPERPLTRRGLQRTEQMMSTLARSGLNVDRLITSSYRRALQTAQIALQSGLAPLLETDERLQPGGDVLGLLETLAGSVVLVGHEPDLGDLACDLLGWPRGGLVLKKAGVVEMQQTNGRWQLRALLRPGL